MTKPANRLGRVNARRIDALARMDWKAPKKSQTPQAAEAEYRALAGRIIAPPVAKVHTKKDRSARGRFSR